MTQHEAMRRLRKLRHSAALGLLLLFPVPAAYSYSVLTHEAIIDSTWDSAIKPLLLKRFPAATADELTQAHAFAYGGCIIQDLGYYPFGSKFFSDLTHYVRSGDFILNLIRDSQDLNEYAFALGALSHYAADNNGHPMAVNRAVPLFYPELGREVRKAGNVCRRSAFPRQDGVRFRCLSGRQGPLRLRCIQRASSDLKWQNPCSSGRSRIPME